MRSFLKLTAALLAAYVVIVGAAGAADLVRSVTSYGNLASDPSGTLTGSQYYNTVSQHVRCYEAGAWKECGTGATALHGSGSSTDAVDLGTAEVAGILPVAKGGGGGATLNGVLYGQGGSLAVATAVGTSGQVLLANGSAVPTFTTLSSGASVSSTGVVTLSLAGIVGSTSWVEVTTSTLTGDVNNYSLGAGTVFRVSSDATRTVTGLAGGTDGRMLVLLNKGAYSIVLSNQDNLSTGSNRIITGTGDDFTLAADAALVLVYDSTDTRWRVVAAGNAGGGTLIQYTAYVSKSGADIAGPLRGTIMFPWLTIAGAMTQLWPNKVPPGDGGYGPVDDMDFLQERTIILMDPATWDETVTLPTGRIALYASGAYINHPLTWDVSDGTYDTDAARLILNGAGALNRLSGTYGGLILGDGTDALIMTNLGDAVPIDTAVTANDVTFAGKVSATDELWLGSFTSLRNAYAPGVGLDMDMESWGVQSQFDTFQDNLIVGSLIAHQSYFGDEVNAGALARLTSCSFGGNHLLTVYNTYPTQLDSSTYSDLLANLWTLNTASPLTVMDNDGMVSAVDEVTGDVTTTSASFTDLLRVNAGSAVSITIVAPTACVAIIHFDGVCTTDSVAGRNVQFQLLLDGSAVTRSQHGVFTLAGQAVAMSITSRVALTQGSHTFKVQWRIAGDTAQINAGTAPAGESKHNAALTVQTLLR